MEIKMGNMVKDQITGFSGIVVGHSEFITGCDKYLVQPKMKAKENAYPSCEWLDDIVLKVMKGKGIDPKTLKIEKSEKTKKKGCHYPCPKR